MCEGRFQVLRSTGRKPSQARYPLRQDGALPTLNLPPDGVLADSEALDAHCETVKRLRGKKLLPTAAGLQASRSEYTRTIAPARALAAETSKVKAEG